MKWNWKAIHINAETPWCLNFQQKDSSSSWYSEILRNHNQNNRLFSSIAHQKTQESEAWLVTPKPKNSVKLFVIECKSISKDVPWVSTWMAQPLVVYSSVKKQWMQKTLTHHKSLNIVEKLIWLPRKEDETHGTQWNGENWVAQNSRIFSLSIQA